MDNDDGMGGGKRLVTGGEDARLCEWDLSGNQQAAASFGNGGSTKSGGKMSGRAAMKSSKGDSKGKGKKKFGSPY